MDPTLKYIVSSLNDTILVHVKKKYFSYIFLNLESTLKKKTRANNLKGID